MISYLKYEKLLATGQIVRLPYDPSVSDVHDYAKPFNFIPKTSGEIWFIGKRCPSLLPVLPIFNYSDVKKVNQINVITDRFRIAEAHFIVYPWNDKYGRDGYKYPLFNEEYPSLKDIECNIRTHLHALFINQDGNMSMATFDYTLCKGQKILYIRG